MLIIFKKLSRYQLVTNISLVLEGAWQERMSEHTSPLYAPLAAAGEEVHSSLLPALLDTVHPDSDRLDTFISYVCIYWMSIILCLTCILCFA